MFDGPETATKVKKNVLGLYLKALDAIDPKVATHILRSQREMFLAGQKFFESEVGHAEKALHKFEAKAEKQDNPPA